MFIAIGHTPNTEIFREKLKLNGAGYILTEPGSTSTNIAGVFAAGDAADSFYRQAVTAAGTGCMAGIDAYHFIQQAEDKFSSTDEIVFDEKATILQAFISSINPAETQNIEKMHAPIVEVNQDNIKELLKSARFVIIDAYTDWCGPCKRLAPIIKELHNEYGDLYQFSKLDAEHERKLAKALMITSYPTVLFFKDGKEMGRRKGFMDKEEFLIQIEKYFHL